MPTQSMQSQGALSNMVWGAPGHLRKPTSSNPPRKDPVKEAQPLALSGVSKIVGRSGGEFFLLNPDDVLAFQAERELVWIVSASRRYLATQALSHIEDRLRGSAFQRIHRNALVNLNHVRRMAPLSSQRWLLTMSNGQEFTVSKRKAHAVRRLVQW